MSPTTALGHAPLHMPPQFPTLKSAISANQSSRKPGSQGARRQHAWVCYLPAIRFTAKTTWPLDPAQISNMQDPQSLQIEALVFGSSGHLTLLASSLRSLIPDA